MTQTQHTPGPWLIANNGKDGKKTDTFRIWRNNPNQPQGIWFRNVGYACIAPHVHGEENANIIAAAPDMLSALEGLFKQFCTVSVILRETGKTDIAEFIEKHLIEEFAEAKTAIVKAKGES